MSTRIAGGFAVDTVDAARLAEMISALRRSLEPRRLREHARLLAERTCTLVDRAIAFDRPWTPVPISSAFGSIDDAGRKSDATGVRAVHEDFGMSLSLIPDASTGTTYGIIHCERSAWRRAWMRTAGVRDFHYQDSADRPSGTPASEWRRRRDTWARVMPTYVPAEHGFEARIFPTRVTVAHDRPLALQPSLATRMEAIARESVMNERMDGVDPDRIVGTIMREAAFLRTPDGERLVRDRAATLRLPRRVTPEIARARARPVDEMLDMTPVRIGRDGELDAGPPSR